jgi:hypothetical protein
MFTGALFNTRWCRCGKLSSTTLGNLGVYHMKYLYGIHASHLAMSDNHKSGSILTLKLKTGETL